MEISYLKYRNALKTVEMYRRQEENKLNILNKEINNILKPNILYNERFILDLDFSIRCVNMLNKYSKSTGVEIKKIKDLNNISIKKIKDNCGSCDRSIKELKELSFIYNFNILP